MKKTSVSLGFCGVVVTGLLALSATPAVAQDASSGTAAPATFTKDVAPVLYKHCTTCHRPGEIAPMSLLTYEEARPWARAIRDNVVEGHDAAVARRSGARHVVERPPAERSRRKT